MRIWKKARTGAPICGWIHNVYNFKGTIFSLEVEEAIKPSLVVDGEASFLKGIVQRLLPELFLKSPPFGPPETRVMAQLAQCFPQSLDAHASHGQTSWIWAVPVRQQGLQCVEIALQSFPEGLLILRDLPHVLLCTGSALIDGGSHDRLIIGLEDASESAPWLGLELMEDLVELVDPLVVGCSVLAPTAEDPVQARPQCVRRFPLQYERVEGPSRPDRHMSSSEKIWRTG